MENSEESLNLTITDGTAEKIFSISSEKLTIIYSCIFVVVFFAGIAGLIYWGKLDSKSLKGPEPTMQLGSLRDNQQNQAVAGAQVHAPVGPEKPATVPSPSSTTVKTPTEAPTATKAPTATASPNPTNTPTPSATPTPTSTPTPSTSSGLSATPSLTPTETPTP